MKSVRTSAAVLGILLLSANDPKEYGYEVVMDELQGVWQFVAVEVDGQGVLVKESDSCLIFRNGQYTWTGTGPNQAGTYRTDGRPKPAHVDMMQMNEPFKGKAEKGIYQIQGNNLKIATRHTSEKRPEHFAEKDLVIITFMRESK